MERVPAICVAEVKLKIGHAQQRGHKGRSYGGVGGLKRGTKMRR